MNQDNSRDLLTTTNIQSYFHQSLQTALDNNKLRVEDETIGYLVRLLSNFLHSDKLFEESEDGLHIRPLALYYAEAISLSSRSNRHRVLQQLGDVALFISGLFADSWNANWWMSITTSQWAAMPTVIWRITSAVSCLLRYFPSFPGIL